MIYFHRPLLRGFSIFNKAFFLLGLVYKNSLGGNEAVVKKFPNIEEQIQIKVK